MLDPRKQLAERLRIYVALFVFVPTFLLTMQRFLPYRSSLSFPEFLLVNLVISTTMIGIFSIVGKLKGTDGVTIIRLYRQETYFSKWDGVGIVLSLVLCSVTYLFTLLRKINLPASLVFSFGILPAYLFWVFFKMSKKYFVKRWRHYLLVALFPVILMLVFWVLSRL